jgi:hypothetical protein
MKLGFKVESARKEKLRFWVEDEDGKMDGFRS